MDLSFIKELHDEGLCVFADSFDDWKDAIACAADPLIKKGYIDKGYVEGIYRNVDLNGFYIFIAPHICLPHCGEFEYVHKKCVSFMKCNKPVIGDENEPEMGAELFFVLATENAGEHIDCLQKLAMILEDEETIDALLAIKNEDDLVKLLHDSSQELSEDSNKHL